MEKSANDDSVECKTHFKTSKKDGKVSKNYKEKEFVAKPAREVKEFVKLCPFEEEIVPGKEESVLAQFIKDSKTAAFDANLKENELIHVYRSTIITDQESVKCKIVVKFEVEGTKATYEFTKNGETAGFIIKKQR